SLERVAAEARARGYVGVAIEGSDPDAMRGAIVGVSLATEEGRGHYIPLGHRYLGCPAQVPWDRARAVLAPLFADGAVVKVAHDLKRASILLERAGARVEGPAFDTLLAAYLIDPESPNGMKELARRELGVSAPRYDETVPKTRGPQTTFDELDVAHAA